jgi:hypothetical protein
MDSPRNCLINWRRLEPRTFLIPTSGAREEERAVARFMKLIHARRRTNRAAAENM